jgi:DNA-binding FrmR family transcriptional regulator
MIHIAAGKGPPMTRSEANDPKLEFNHEHEDESSRSHPHTHAHSHTHPHTETKAVLNRLSKAAGHLESVRKMVESGRDCSDVLIQLSAVISALNSAGKVILKDHLEHCIAEAVQQNDHEAIEKLNRAIDSFIK